MASGENMIESIGRRVGLGLAARGDVRDTVEYALRAEALGFESVWIHDSYFERDPITYLATMARRKGHSHRGGRAQPVYASPCRPGDDGLRSGRSRSRPDSSGAGERIAAPAWPR